MPSRDPPQPVDPAPSGRIAKAPLRPRVAIIAGADHPDFDMAFIAIVAVRCDVLLCAPASLSSDELGALGCVDVRQWPWPRHRQVAQNLRLIWRLRQTILAFEPDCVHVLSEGQIWLNLLPLAIAPVPMVVTLHDVLPHPGDQDTARVPRAAVNAFVRQAKAVIVHGEGLRAQAVSNLRLKQDRVFVGSHPVTDRYQRLARAAGLEKADDGVFRILFFGRIYAYKGLAHLIDADALIGPDILPRLTTIAGRGEDMSAYTARMSEPARFDVRARRIPDLEAAQLFTDADLLVLPYVEASQSGVLLVAAAFGLPVVASDVGEIGALVARTRMGRLVPAADAAALADAITELAGDAALRAELSANARDVADGVLSPETIWSQTELAYNRARQPA